MRFQYNTKMNIIYSAYESIREAANGDSYGTLEFQQQIDEVCIQNNITLYIMDANSKSIYVSSNGGQELEKRLIGYIFGFPMEKIVVIEHGEDYWMQQTGIEGNEYLEMYGRLNVSV